MSGLAASQVSALVPRYPQCSVFGGDPIETWQPGTIGLLPPKNGCFFMDLSLLAGMCTTTVEYLFPKDMFGKAMLDYGRGIHIATNRNKLTVPSVKIKVVTTQC